MHLRNSRLNKVFENGSSDDVLVLFDHCKGRQGR